MTDTTIPTKSQLSALKWLLNRNGDGMFDRNGVLLAGGERAPVMRSTWNSLVKWGLVEEYADRKRLRATLEGKLVRLTDGVEESK